MVPSEYKTIYKVYGTSEHEYLNDCTSASFLSGKVDFYITDNSTLPDFCTYDIKFPEFSKSLKINTFDLEQTVFCENDCSYKWIDEYTLQITHNFNSNVDYVLKRNGGARVIPVDYVSVITNDQNQDQVKVDDNNNIFIKFTDVMFGELDKKNLQFDLIVFKLTEYNATTNIIQNEHQIFYKSFTIPSGTLAEDFKIPVSSFSDILCTFDNYKDSYCVETIIREKTGDTKTRVLFGNYIETTVTKRTKTSINKEVLKFSIPNSTELYNEHSEYEVIVYSPLNVETKKYEVTISGNTITSDSSDITLILSNEINSPQMLQITHGFDSLVNYIIKGDNGLLIKLNDLYIEPNKYSDTYNDVAFIIPNEVLTNLTKLTFYLYFIYKPSNGYITVVGE